MKANPDKAIILLNLVDPQVNTIKVFIDACKESGIEYIIVGNKQDRIKDTKEMLYLKKKLEEDVIPISVLKDTDINTVKTKVNSWNKSRVIILGVFNSGKTSFINKLCKTDYPVGDLPGTTLHFTETKYKDSVIIDSVGQLIDVNKPMMVSIDFSDCKNRWEKIDKVFTEEVEGLLSTSKIVRTAIHGVIDNIETRLKEGGKIITTGAGASALVAKEIAGQGTECGLPVVVMTNDGAEIQPITFSKGLGEQEGGISRYISNVINPNDIVIAVSASGGTGFVTDTLKRAKDKGAFTIAITENSDTPLVRNADVVLKSEAKPEGPCLHPDTPIMEANKGLTKISDIKRGDSILSVKRTKYSIESEKYKQTKGFFDRGLKWSKINNINKYKTKNLIEIKYQGGGCIKSTPNHVFFNSKGNKILAKDLEVGMKLFKPKTAMDLQGFNNKQKIELYAYYTAEGSTGKGSVIFTIHSKELQEGLIGDKIIKHMKSIYDKEPRIKYKHNGTTCDLWFHSTKAQRDFEKICGKGAWNKKVPYWLNKCNLNLFSKYMQAIIEGDGYITKSGKARLRSVSKKLIAELGWICQMHNIPYSISKMKQQERKIRDKVLKESHIWQLQIGKNGWNELNNTNNKNIVDIKTPFGIYKRDINKPLRQHAIIKSIRHISYDGDVYDLVDVEGNCFYAGDTPILTHNSSSKIQTAHLVIGHTLMLVLADETGVTADSSVGFMMHEILANKKMGIK